MDVRLFAFLAGPRSASLLPRERFCGLPKRGLAFLLANALFWQPLWAQAADGIVVSAPGTSLDRAGNGVPIVNIAAPNGSGLSHNRFSDYNVGQQGVILNNATARTQATQLGGIVLGNPNLKGAAATTILNEVNGANPSQLRGYTEVAGQRAHVIVANPHGITCDGCGFINTPRATLTTGRPVIENGQLRRYQVDQGQVAIEGAGLNASNVDSFEVITRSAKINAQIQARDLTIIAGRNDVDARTLAATARAENGSAKPQLAIDSSALGGMYAGSIKLVGTEAGVGVKLDGKLIASAGDIQLDANGQLRMAQVSAAGDLRAKAQQITLDGPAYATGTAELNASGQLNNHQSLAAGKRIQLSAAQLDNNGIVEAGVNADNSRNALGDVTLTAQNMRNSGSVAASRNLQVDVTDTLDNQGGTLKGNSVHLAASALDNRRGRMIGDTQLDLVGAHLDNREGQVVAERLTVTGGTLDNRLGLFSAEQAITFDLDTLDNSGKGTLVSNGSFQARVKQQLDNQADGLLSAKGTLSVQADSLNNRGGLVVGDAGVTLSGANLDNSANGMLSSRNGALSLTLSGALDNHDQGALVSQGDLMLRAESLNNANGTLSTQANLGLNLAGDLDNRNGGLLSAQGTLSGGGGVLDNRGGWISANGVNLDAASLDNSGGSLVSGDGLHLGLLGALLNIGKGSTLAGAGPLDLQAASIDNRGGQLVGQKLQVVAASLDNSAGGTIASQDALELTLSDALINRQDGLIYSKAGALDITTTALDNVAGTLRGQLDTTLRVQDAIDNQGGHITSQAGNLDLHGARLDNSRGGVLSAAGWLKLIADGFSNRSGTTQAQSLEVQVTTVLDNRDGHLSATRGDNRIVADELDNRGGGLYAGGLLHVRGHQLLNQGDSLGQVGTIGAADIDFSLQGTLNNQYGLIESSGSLAVQATNVDNGAGSLRALGQVGATRLTVSELLNNARGRIETAAEDLDLQVGTLQNSAGTVLHVGNGHFGIDLAQAGLAGGTFTTHGDLGYQGASWTNNAIIQARNLTLDIGQLNQGASGQLLAVERFTGTGTSWSNSGMIASDGSLDLTLSGHYGASGRLSSVDSLTLSTGSINLGQTASIAGGGISTVSSGGTLENNGRLTSSGDLKVSAGALNNRGTLGSGGDLYLSAGNVLNENGLIFSGGDMQLRAQNLTNRHGDIYSLGNLHVAANNQQGWASSLQNISGSIESAGAMTLLAQDFDNRRDDNFQIGQQVVAGHIRMFADDVCDGKGCEFQFSAWERIEDVITRDSPQGSITAGGDFQFRGGSFANLYSSIASGGNIDIQAVDFRNQGAAGGIERHLSGGFYTRTDAYYWTFRSNADRYNSYNGYAPGRLTLDQVMVSGGYPSQSFHHLSSSEVLVSGTPVANAVIQAAGNVTINASGKFDNSVVRRNAGSKPITPRNVNSTSDPVSGQFAVTSQLPPDLVQRQVNPIGLPSFSLPYGENGLFRLSGQTGAGPDGLIAAQEGVDAVPGAVLNVPRVQGVPSIVTPNRSHKYLVETNPELTQLKNFLGSDYLLDRLGHDPDKAQKRLGDGLYEQRLIQQAVVARTGQRYINGMNSDEALFKYLMDNAIAYKDSLRLQVGIGLTAEQVAALTHDIVWLEEAVVNGEKVLVPVLYLAQADGRLAPNGALIMGNDIALISGSDLTNQGTLRASGNLSATATHIDNGGLIEVSKRLDLLAIESIRNAAGGIINGGNVTITAVKGDVINERTITALDRGNAASRIHEEIANNAARIESRGELGITAGRDLVSTGSVIQAAGNAQLQAGQDLRIESAQAVDSADFKSRRMSGNITSVTQHGSDVQVGGDLQMTAGRDLNVVASHVEATGDLALNAGRDVLISSAANESHNNTDYKGGGKEILRQDDKVHQQAAELKAGGDVVVNAGKNITLVSSKIGAGDEAYLVAGDKIELLAANDSEYSLYDMKKKGHWGQSKTQRDEVTDIKVVGSEIRAGSGITLLSGGDQKYQGAKLDSGNDLAIISGGSVTFEAVKDLHQESHEKSKGNLAWQSAKGKGQTDETLRQTQLTAQGNVAIKAVEGLKIDIKHIDQKSVSQAIDAMVKADLNLAWLKEAEQRGDVDWRQVQEIHDSWKYSSSGLGAAPSLVISIVASAYLGPLYGAMASNLAIGTINNGGDLGRGLKFAFNKEALQSYAITVATAYVISPYLDEAFGVSTDNASKITKGFDLGNVTDIAKFSAFLTAQGVAQAGVETVIEGGSFSENLKAYLASQASNLGMAIGFNLIGDWSLGKCPDGSPQKVMAHALFGGLMAEAMGSDFKTGALAAGANEALSNALVNLVGGDDRLELMASQIVGLLAAAVVDGDLEQGSEIAKYATAYNQQVHRQAKERLERGLEVLQEQGKYLDLDADTVLADLRKIADGNLSSSAELDPRVVQFLNAEFSPAGLRDTLFEPEGWEQYAALAIDLLFPLPSAKTAAARRIADKISGEALEAFEAKFGADLLAGGAKGASSTASSSEAIWSSTKSKSAVENALGHWDKHKSEFPEIQNAKQYAEKAKSFLTNPPQGTLTKTNTRGDTLRYDPGTNTFGVVGQDGAPRTMFRPADGINYWNRQ